MKNRIDTIDDFLAGKSMPSESIEIQELASKDPAFRMELEKQEEIIDAVSQFRRAQLKARLSKLQVQKPFFQSKVGMSIVFASLALVCGALSLTLIDLNENARGTSSTSPTIVKKSKLKEIDEKLTLEHVIEDIEVAKKAVVTENKEGSAESDSLPIVMKRQTESAAIVEPIDVERAPVIAPVVVMHENEMLLDEDVETDLSLVQSYSTFTDQSAGIVAENKAGRFHYRYKNKKVFVQIDDYTNEEQATLLHFAESQKIYIYYKKEYYELLRSNDWVPLVEARVVDSELVKQLNAKLK